MKGQDFLKKNISDFKEDLAEESTNHKKIKRILPVVLAIWLGMIVFCVGIREYRNSNFLWMYENPKYDSKYHGGYDLHIDRQFHFLSFQNGVIGISYHYKIDVYVCFHPDRFLGMDDMGIFWISLFHYGYIQDGWPISLHEDHDITTRVQ